MADLTVRLLARLYPSLELRVEAGADEEAERLAGLARAINPEIELGASATVGIAVGHGAPGFDRTFFAGSEGWDALLSERGPVPTGSSPNPLGAGAAACLATGEVFKHVFLSGSNERFTGDIRYSTFNAEKTRTPEHVPNSDWQVSDFAVLVGLGAIGNGAVWALARGPFSGAIHLVDHEAIELSNLQRYVLASRGDEGRAKVEVAGTTFSGRLQAIPCAQTWAQFLEESGYLWSQVLVALDTAAGRLSVQAALPGWIANAWTQPGDLGVSVHGGFDGTGACLSCLYLRDQAAPNEDEVVADALGVPQLAAEIRTLLHTGAGISGQLLEAVAAALGVPPDAALRFEGRPIRDLYVEGVCGGALIPLGSTGLPRQEVHVPLAHQSALAGVLLSAALAKHSLGAAEDVTRITRIDILGPLGDFLTQPAMMADNRSCICEDEDYVAAFRAKYRPTTQDEPTDAQL